MSDQASEMPVTQAGWLRAVADLLDERAPGLPAHRQDVWIAGPGFSFHPDGTVADAWLRLRAVAGAAWKLQQSPEVVELTVPLPGAAGEVAFVFWLGQIGARTETVATPAERWVLPGEAGGDAAAAGQ